MSFSLKRSRQTPTQIVINSKPHRRPWKSERNATIARIRSASGKPRVFISNRPEDINLAGRIARYLGMRIGRENVHFDMSSSRAPESGEWRIRLIASCTALVVIVGRHWPVDRLKNEGDYIQEDIRIALQRNLLVIPVLTDGASMPSAGDLPADIRLFTYRPPIVLQGNYFADVLRGLDQVIRPRSRFRRTFHYVLTFVVVACALLFAAYNSKMLSSVFRNTSSRPIVARGNADTFVSGSEVPAFLVRNNSNETIHVQIAEEANRFVASYDLPGHKTFRTGVIPGSYIVTTKVAGIAPSVSHFEMNSTGEEELDYAVRPAYKTRK